jgi:hypothetical protein
MRLPKGVEMLGKSFEVTPDGNQAYGVHRPTYHPRCSMDHEFAKGGERDPVELSASAGFAGVGPPQLSAILRAWFPCVYPPSHRGRSSVG